MKKYAYVAVLLVVILGGALAFAYVRNSMEAEKQNSQQASKTEEQDTSKTNDTSPDEKDTDRPDTNTQPGSYVEYSETKVADADGTKLLFFHASWCPQCQMVDADIKKDGIPDGVTVFKVDYDSNQELRKKYGVTLQTTFVKIDDDGNEIKKFVAYNEPTFDSVKENLL